jgi:hypothetical protein
VVRLTVHHDQMQPQRCALERRLSRLVFHTSPTRGRYAGLSVFTTLPSLVSRLECQISKALPGTNGLSAAEAQPPGSHAFKRLLMQKPVVLSGKPFRIERSNPSVNSPRFFALSYLTMVRMHNCFQVGRGFWLPRPDYIRPR